MQQKQSATSQEKDRYNVFYLDSDIARARIGILILISPIIIFSINDYVLYGFTVPFYSIIALRMGLLFYTIWLMQHLNKIKKYAFYVKHITAWSIVTALVIVTINWSRPPSFIPTSIATTILFTLIGLVIIPNFFRYQIIVTSILNVSEISLISLYASDFGFTTLVTGFFVLALAYTIGLISCWQLGIYRISNFEAHEKLRRSRDFSEQKYEQLVEKLPEMVFEINDSGRLIFANLRARELTGYTKEEFDHDFDANRLVAFEDVERSRENMKLMFAQGLRQSKEYTWIKKNGTRFPVLLISVPVVSDGKIVGARGIATDLTERKNMEKQLRDSERLAAIGQTAGMVGHDIRNPLQAIVSDIYLIKEELGTAQECENKEGIAESLASVEQNINYINKIVSDLQDYSRQITPDYSYANFSDVLVRTFESLMLPDSIKLSIKVNDLEKVRTDPLLLQRAIANLISNAIQAMPQGGNLEITGQPKDNRVVITITDTGMGIPEEVKAKLFTPMVTTKSKGQGFGLAVSKRLIEALNGTISFESEEGKGTKFIIELPTS